MESFLNSTTAHGLSRLTSAKGPRKMFWGCICLFAYVSAFYTFIALYKNYVDPNNLKTVLSTTVMRPGAQGEAVRLVGQCVDGHWTDLWTDSLTSGDVNKVKDWL